jgi:hypothetical protein
VQSNQTSYTTRQNRASGGHGSARSGLVLSPLAEGILDDFIQLKKIRDIPDDFQVAAIKPIEERRSEFMTHYRAFDNIYVGPLEANVSDYVKNFLQPKSTEVERDVMAPKGMVLHYDWKVSSPSISDSPLMEIGQFDFPGHPIFHIRFNPRMKGLLELDWKTFAVNVVAGKHRELHRQLRTMMEEKLQDGFRLLSTGQFEEWDKMSQEHKLIALTHLITWNATSRGLSRFQKARFAWALVTSSQYLETPSSAVFNDYRVNSKTYEVIAYYLSTLSGEDLAGRLRKVDKKLLFQLDLIQFLEVPVLWPKNR